jgi:hypothetical protein
MSSKSLIEAADRKSRLRPILFALATLVYLLVQIITRPGFGIGDYVHGARAYAWVVNAVLLLLCLSGVATRLGTREMRNLVDDDVARMNQRTACAAGFWVTVGWCLTSFIVPALRQMTGPQATYLAVTIGTAAAMLTFSWLEYRAHADA